MPEFLFGVNVMLTHSQTKDQCVRQPHTQYNLFHVLYSASICAQDFCLIRQMLQQGNFGHGMSCTKPGKASILASPAKAIQTGMLATVDLQRQAPYPAGCKKQRPHATQISVARKEHLSAGRKATRIEERDSGKWSQEARHKRVETLGKAPRCTQQISQRMKIWALKFSGVRMFQRESKGKSRAIVIAHLQIHE